MSPRAVVLLAILTSIGCLPVELDVTPDGGLVISRQEGWFLFDPATNAVRKLRDAGADAPVFARVSPDGRSLLTLAEVQGRYSEFDLTVGPIDGGATRRLLRARNPAYVRYSPDGSHIALIRMSVEPQVPERDTEVLELVLVDSASGEARVLGKQVGPQFDWSNDGTHLYAAKIIGRTKQHYVEADLVRIDVATGAVTPVARVVSGEGSQFDVAPDSQSAAVCAFAIGPPGEALAEPERPRHRLHIVDLSSGVASTTAVEAACAIYSPDGESMLIAEFPYSGTLTRGTQLLIAAADGGSPRVIAKDAHVGSPLGGDTPIYPGWIDRDRLFYFSERRVYGTSGRGLALLTMRRDGTDRRNVQSVIDAAASAADPQP